MKRYQNSLLAGVAALALVAGTGLASAQQSKEPMGGSQAGSPQAGQSMNKGSQPQAQEKGKATQTQAQEKGKSTQTQAQEKGKANANRAAQTGKENMNPSGQEPGKMGKRGAQNERQNTLKGLRGDTTKPMQGENENQKGSKSSTKGNTSNQAQQQTPQNNMQRGTQNTQRGTESGNNMQRGTQPNQGGAQVGGGTQTGQGGAQVGGGRTAEGVNVQLNEQQRTEIRQTVINGRNAPRVGRVDFDVRIGTVIPRGKIHIVPVPETLVRIEPRWRGFLYFVYEDEIVVVNPRNYHIVAVLPV